VRTELTLDAEMAVGRPLSPPHQASAARGGCWMAIAAAHKILQVRRVNRHTAPARNSASHAKRGLAPRISREAYAEPRAPMEAKLARMSRTAIVDARSFVHCADRTTMSSISATTPPASAPARVAVEAPCLRSNGNPGPTCQAGLPPPRWARPHRPSISSHSPRQTIVNIDREPAGSLAPPV
jgi:hypothetical protein